jgi:hypothetical protein
MSADPTMLNVWRKDNKFDDEGREFEAHTMTPVGALTTP